MKDTIKILLIDEDLEFHYIFKYAFKQVELISAYTIDGALWLLSQPKRPFDLILLDNELGAGHPPFKGLERLVKSTYTPVVLTTAYTDTNTRFEAQKRGAAAYLSKGNFDLNSWAEALRTVLTDGGRLEPRALVSYVEEDAFFVKYLSDKLIEHQINIKVNGLPREGQPLTLTDEELAATDYFLLVLSPEAIQSDRLALELDLALRLEADQRIRGVFPLMLKACALPQGMEGKKVIGFEENAKFEEGIKKVVGTLKR